MFCIEKWSATRMLRRLQGKCKYLAIQLDRVKRIWYLSPMRAAKFQASLRIRAVSPEPPLLAHTSSESRGTFRQKARSLASRNGWSCAVKICHDVMLEDTNSLDGAQLISKWNVYKNRDHYFSLVLNMPTDCLADITEISTIIVKQKMCSFGVGPAGIL